MSFDTFIIDLWGVMHNGKEIFPLKQLNVQNKLISSYKKNLIINFKFFSKK